MCFHIVFQCTLIWLHLVRGFLLCRAWPLHPIPNDHVSQRPCMSHVLKHSSCATPTKLNEIFVHVCVYIISKTPTGRGTSDPHPIQSWSFVHAEKVHCWGPVGTKVRAQWGPNWGKLGLSWDQNGAKLVQWGPDRAKLATSWANVVPSWDQVGKGRSS